MAVTFRNLEFNPDEPVERWPFEAVLTALERGGLSHWRRLAEAVRREPWGPLALSVETAVAATRPYGVTELMQAVIDHARRAAAARERADVADAIRDLVAASGLTQAEFAAQIGTSASRLSTYISGKVTPSAALMLRIERVAAG